MMLPVDSLLRQTSILLARFAACATGARAYSLSQGDERTRAGIEAKRNRSSFVRYLIHLDDAQLATLEFAFDQDPIPEEKLMLLDRMAGAIELVQELPYSSATMAARAASLDVELAEIKISERARGLLAGGTDATEAVEAIVRHVEQVLCHRQLGAVFDQLLPELEERLAERKLLIEAKSLLQRRHGMSEEQAYIHLRNRSRASRRRLREVAEETISQSSHTLTEKREGVAI